MIRLALLSATLILSVILFGQNVPIDFEVNGIGANFTWTVFENDTNPPLEIVPNPDATGINTSTTVAKFTALQAGAPFAGCETMHGSDIGTFTITQSNKYITIMVYKDVISDVGIKLVSFDNSALPEIKIPNTLVNEWEAITFDFTQGLGVTYDQIVIFPDFQARSKDNIIYFDNIYDDSIIDTTTNFGTENMVTFQVNMNDEITAGNFDPLTQFVFTTGGNANTPESYFYCGEQMIDYNNNGIYEITKTYNNNITILFKYYIGELADINSNNCVGSAAIGYEPYLPSPCGFGNYFDRQVVVDTSDIVLDPVCFGTCNICDIMVQACIEVLNISGVIFTGTYEADNNIFCGGIVNANSTGAVIFKAGANANAGEFIELNNGFEATGEVDFTAINEQCNFND